MFAKSTFDIEVWIKEHGVEARDEQSWNGSGARWIVPCPFNEDHRGTSAAIMRAGDGQLAFRCQHDGCATKRWADFRAHFEPGWKPYGQRGKPGSHSSSTAAMVGATGWPEPEDRGTAKLSEQGRVEYVEDMGIRPGRISVVAAEEGAGKSYAVDDELGIRVAVAGGAFAGTWPIKQRGSVLVLSEMHSDDDFEREETTLASLELARAALVGKYYRLPLMTAANGTPALMEAGWRDWIIEWCRQHEIILMIFDTATGAVQGDPWGEQIREVFRSLRAMLETCPQLAIVLIVHLKKPNGQGGRRVSDVMGEWGRWSDVIVMLERDGPRTKISTHKRVRTERRIVATRSGGLLVDPKDISDGSGPKVPPNKVGEVVRANPGISVGELGVRLEVTRATAHRYAEHAEAAGLIRRERGLPKGALRLFPADSTVSASQTVSRSAETMGETVGPDCQEATVSPSHVYISETVAETIRTVRNTATAPRPCALCRGPAEDDSELCAEHEREAGA